MQSPATQVAPVGHTLLQPPQCTAFVCVSTHSFVQSAAPPEHTHAPLIQVAPTGHVRLQPPQWSARVCVSTHSAPQGTPLAHVALPPPPATPPDPDENPPLPWTTPPLAAPPSRVVGSPNR